MDDRTTDFLGGSHNDYYMAPLQVCRIMSLYNRLLKERKRLGKFVLRFPKTNQELLDRKRWDRIVAILMRRYEYGIEDAVMEQYRYGDFRDEIAAVRR